MLKTIFLICAIIIAGLAAIPEVNSLEVEVTAIRMYAQIEEQPYYNLTEYWIVVVSPDQIVVQDLSDEWSFGFAYWDIEDTSSICNMIPDVEKYDACGDEWLMVGSNKVDGCWDGNCIPLLWHEMRHLLCDCQWHKNMTQERVYVQNAEGWM